MSKAITAKSNLAKRFILEYTVDMNPRLAAIRSGFRPSNALHQATMLLDDPEIRDEIEILLEKRRATYEVTEKRVIGELACIAFQDVSDFYNENGTMKQLDDLPPQVRKVISSVQTRSVGKGRKMREYKQYQTYDKMRALEMLGKYLALFTEKVDISGKLDIRKLGDDDLTKLITDLTSQAGLGDVIDGEATEVEGA